MRNSVYPGIVVMLIGAILIGIAVNKVDADNRAEFLPPDHISLDCVCGVNLICYISHQPEHWPIDITCAGCRIRYIVTRKVKE